MHPLRSRAEREPPNFVVGDRIKTRLFDNSRGSVREFHGTVTSVTRGLYSWQDAYCVVLDISIPGWRSHTLGQIMLSPLPLLEDIASVVTEKE